MRKLLLIVLVAVPVLLRADMGSLPADTVWYLHADLEGMRNSDSGSQVYRWLDGEIFVELNDEIGIDVGREVDRVTAFSAEGAGIVIVLEGPVSQTTRDKLLALVALESRYDLRDHKGAAYYFAGVEPEEAASNDPFGDLDKAAYFSFALPEKMLVTSSEGQMQELLDNKGHIAGGGNHADALFVLTADRSFMQAGLRAEQFVDDDDDWNSNILRNTEQAAVLIADHDGLLAIEAQIRSRDARMAQSIGSVINGLIGLQAFNSDLDPELRQLISNTRIDVKDSELSLRTVFDPAVLIRALNDGND